MRSDPPAMHSHSQDVVLRAVTAAASAAGRFRLVLVVGPDEAAAPALEAAAAHLGGHRINLGAALAKRLVGVPVRLRPVQFDKALREALPPGDVVLDHTEVLFEPSLEARPLELLQHLARARTVVARWPGAVEGGHLVYAEPGHPEHVREPVGQTVVADLSGHT